MSELRLKVLDYLANHNVMTLATNGPSGPWAAAVFYVNAGFTLTFLSSPRSRHAEDLSTDPRCAAAIHEDYNNWTEIKGIQIEGRVRVLSGSERIGAARRYAEKFPVTGPDQAPALIRVALKRVTWYELVPEHCHFVDNELGFGHRDEIPLP
ncbi:MAG: pyridoxamine 5'-phosphate oxidase family protein [Acidobacteria bacterium]|nr:pyridoxamine 5'-phosphate oxidase family protein [Acidobacteriota bacterium]